MKKSSNYLIKIIKKYPKITGGRKNYEAQSKRIENVYELIKKFKKNLKKKNGWFKKFIMDSILS
mgnify:CR=1 FL=1